MKKAKAKLSANAPTLSFVGKTYLCHDHGIGIQTRHIAFEKKYKMLGKERGFHDGTIFKVSTLIVSPFIIYCLMLKPSSKMVTTSNVSLIPKEHGILLPHPLPASFPLPIS
jgi:hypothetical protein